LWATSPHLVPLVTVLVLRKRVTGSLANAHEGTFALEVL